TPATSVGLQPHPALPEKGIGMAAQRVARLDEGPVLATGQRTGGVVILRLIRRRVVALNRDEMTDADAAPAPIRQVPGVDIQHGGMSSPVLENPVEIRAELAETGTVAFDVPRRADATVNRVGLGGPQRPPIPAR